MFPIIEVSHLPSSASFYSAILQPLGLFYVPHARGGDSQPTHIAPSEVLAQSTTLTVAYGPSSATGPVLQLRELKQPKSSHLVFAVSSPAIVAEFRDCAKRADPADPGLAGLSRLTGTSITPDPGGKDRCRIRDLNNNTLEVIYMPCPHHSEHEAASNCTPSPSRLVHYEPGRIISWDNDITASEREQGSGLLAAPGVSPTPREPFAILRRSVTTSTIEETPGESPAPTDEGPGANSILGAVLGAAAGAFAGAALTYGVMRSERDRVPRQDFETPPLVTRRATYPDQFPEPRAQGGRYVEVERTVEKIRYPEHYAPIAEHRSPPQYLAKYSQPNAPASRVWGDLHDDGHNYRPSQRGSRATSTARTRTEVPGDQRRAPLMLMEHEHRSKVGQRHSASQTTSARIQSCEPTDGDTYVSARSRRSVSTVRGPPPPTVETELAVRSRTSSKAPSRAPSARAAGFDEKTVVSVKGSTARPPSHVHGRASSKTSSSPASGMGRNGNGGGGGAGSVSAHIPPNSSRTLSHVSARNIGLPMSGVGSSHAGWDDDNISVAPSDSISCVGSKTSRRRYSP